MKKLLLLVGILVVSGMAAATEFEGKGQVDIYAQVVDNLVIETTPLNFGTIARGQEKKVGRLDKGAGSFTIKGASNTTISFTMTDAKNPNIPFIDGKGVVKLNIEGAAVDSGDYRENMNPEIQVTQGNNGFTNSFSLGKNQTEMEFNVFGKISSNERQFTGRYKGALIVKAKYDEYPSQQ